MKDTAVTPSTETGMPEVAETIFMSNISNSSNSNRDQRVLGKARAEIVETWLLRRPRTGSMAGAREIGPPRRVLGRVQTEEGTETEVVSSLPRPHCAKGE